MSDRPEQLWLQQDESSVRAHVNKVQMEVAQYSASQTSQEPWSFPAHCSNIPKGWSLFSWSKMAATIFQTAGWKEQRRRGTRVCTTCLLRKVPENWLANLVTCSHLAAKETGKCSSYTQQHYAQKRNYITMKEGKKDLGGQLMVSLKAGENVSLACSNHESSFLLSLPSYRVGYDLIHWPPYEWSPFWPDHSVRRRRK